METQEEESYQSITVTCKLWVLIQINIITQLIFKIASKY